MNKFIDQDEMNNRLIQIDEEMSSLRKSNTANQIYLLVSILFAVISLMMLHSLVWYVLSILAISLFVILLITNANKKRNLNIEKAQLNNVIANQIQIAEIKENERRKHQPRYTKARKLTDDYVVFDFETTGLYSSSDEIIEIGAIKFVDDQEIDRFHSYVRPVDNYISDVITDLTGITYEMVSNSPTIDIIFPSFLEFIDGFDLIAHNASFDMKFLLAASDKINVKEDKKYRVIDTLSLSRRTFPRLENHKLTTLKEMLKIETGSHNALDDCYVTSVLYQEIKSRK